jgi:anti-anti-sigma factor
MKIEIRDVGSVSVLDLHGKFAGRECYQLFHDAVDRLLDQGKRHVVVNLAAVPWVDTAGVGALMAGYYAFIRQGGRMKFANLTSRVDDVFFTLDLRHILEVYDSETEAMAAFTLNEA